jgi:tetratricopeptide (TPR) repeat protein
MLGYLLDSLQSIMTVFRLGLIQLIFAGMGLCCWIGMVRQVAVAKEQPETFPPNPLEITLPDPLQPTAPPTGTNRERFIAALDALNAAATQEFQVGNRDAAFELWNRELRLRRYLGAIEETQALAKVGQIAWESNNTQQVRYISQRLQTLQTEAPQQPDPSAVLTELGAAYVMIRAPQLALSAYQQLLEIARQKRDGILEFNTLNTIAQLHLDWFGYPQAAEVYQQLLKQAQEDADPVNQIAYLYQLAYVYDQAKQPSQAIPILQELIQLYGQTPQPDLLPRLQLQLADSYAAVEDSDSAELAYQEAYTMAQGRLQFGYAGQALRKLAQLYRRLDRLDAAIQVYDFLTTFEQEQLLNAYNAMDAFDQLGQIYLLQEKYPEAVAAFERGQTLAQSLNVRIDYFADQIRKAQSR